MLLVFFFYHFKTSTHLSILTSTMNVHRFRLSVPKIHGLRNSHCFKKKALNYWKFWQWHLLKKKSIWKMKKKKKKVPTLYFSLFIYFITRVCTCSALALHGVTERDTNARRPFPHCRLIPGSAVSVLALLWDKKKNGKALDRLNITWVSKLDAGEIIPNFQLVSLAQWWSGCWRARSSRLPNCLMKKKFIFILFQF